MMSEHGIIALKKAVSGQKELLFQLNQKYLYEMSQFYDNPMDDSGIIHYGYLDTYFEDPEREALLIMCGSTVCGFVLLNRYSHAGRCPDHAIAEFTVFPKYRRRHIGSEAVRLLLERGKGCWEVKYNEKNEKAARFWNRLAAPYGPEVIRLNDEETVLYFRV